MEFKVYWFDIENNEDGTPFTLSVDNFEQVKSNAIDYLGNAVRYFSENDLRYAKDEKGEIYHFDKKENVRI
ncbi:hypothetical protein HYZ41_03845 [archaeon]|nr:hypothetical protein [archaeon]